MMVTKLNELHFVNEQLYWYWLLIYLSTVMSTRYQKVSRKIYFSVQTLILFQLNRVNRHDDKYLLCVERKSEYKRQRKTKVHFLCLLSSFRKSNGTLPICVDSVSPFFPFLNIFVFSNLVCRWPLYQMFKIPNESLRKSERNAIGANEMGRLLCIRIIRWTKNEYWKLHGNAFTIKRWMNGMYSLKMAQTPIGAISFVHIQ